MATKAKKMKVTALAPWFGSNRILAENVGAALRGCKWVGVPFAGGMCELAHIDARTLLVNDLHHHVINLARVVSHDILGPRLIRRLRRKLCHPVVLTNAQETCRKWTGAEGDEGVYMGYAEAYFVCAWMARNGKAGCSDEFDAGLSIRYEAQGGDSAVRYFSAVDSLRDWRRVLRKATFTVLDVHKFLAKCHDEPSHGIYCDPPFPGAGGAYLHNPGTGADEIHWHTMLAESLNTFSECRVVCRFYDHPLVRKLYREKDGWTWNKLTGRKQTNEAAPEVLLVRNGA